MITVGLEKERRDEKTIVGNRKKKFRSNMFLRNCIIKLSLTKGRAGWGKIQNFHRKSAPGGSPKVLRAWAQKKGIFGTQGGGKEGRASLE